MKKILVLLLICLFNCTKTFALEIVYPKSNPCTINASSTFFIGSTNPKDVLKINGIEVKLAPSGAFAQFVPLSVGKNEFNIEVSEGTGNRKQETAGLDCHSADKKTVSQALPDNQPFMPHTSLFTIIRTQPSTSTKTTQPLIEYPTMIFYTKTDNTPLRTTPVDSGINRMSHLPKDMALFINGEQSGFYRVYLNSKTIGWINKDNVEQKTDDKKVNPITPIKLKKQNAK